MLKKLIRIILGIAGLSTGVAIGINIAEQVDISKIINLSWSKMLLDVLFIVLCGLILGIIVYIIAPFLINQAQKLAKYIEKEITKLPLEQVVLSGIGLTAGFILAFVIGGFTKKLIPIPIINNALSVAMYLFLGYLGVRIGSKSKLDFTRIIEMFSKKTSEFNVNNSSQAKPKILDTSVIIDGRILDICKTKFIEGQLVIPEFVLKELRHIADSSDALKRKRGRRGLDILKKIQSDIDNEVVIDSTDFKDVGEVDIKLIKLAQKLNGMVATHDYNLNKVADLHGVDVLNINELANAVKPIVIPGEDMVVTVVKEGKENNQGLAYLDDGTMIVIENGKDLIGETVSVIVTTALQTAAGKMIFVKPK